MTIDEEIQQKYLESKAAMQSANEAGDVARKRFAESLPSRDRIAKAFAEGYQPDLGDLLVIEGYRILAQIALDKDRRFVELTKEGDALRCQSRENRK